MFLSVINEAVIVMSSWFMDGNCPENEFLMVVTYERTEKDNIIM